MATDAVGDYLSRPMTPADPVILEAVESGPIALDQALKMGRPATRRLQRLELLRDRYDPDGRFHSWMGLPGEAG